MATAAEPQRRTRRGRAAGRLHLIQQRIEALRQSGIHLRQRPRNQILLGAHFEDGIAVVGANFVFACGKDAHEFQRMRFQEGHQPSAFLNQPDVGRQHRQRILVGGERNARFKCDRADAPLQKFIFERLDRRVRGENVVDHHPLLDKAQSDVACLFHQRVKNIVARLNRAHRALMVDSIHRRHLDDSLQRASKAQALDF